MLGSLEKLAGRVASSILLIQVSQNIIDCRPSSQSDSNRSLLSSVVGAGVLAMPLAMAHMGIILGVCVILWSGITSGFGLYLQSRCAQYLDRGTASFFALSQITYPNAAVIFDAAIAIKCFGVGVSYLIIIGDLMPGVVQGFVGDSPAYDFLMDRHFWVTAFMFVYPCRSEERDH